MIGTKFRSVVTSVGEERERDQRKITEGLELHTEPVFLMLRCRVHG